MNSYGKLVIDTTSCVLPPSQTWSKLLEDDSFVSSATEILRSPSLIIWGSPSHIDNTTNHDDVLWLVCVYQKPVQPVLM